MGPNTTLDQTRQGIAYLLLGTLGVIILLQAIASIAFASDCWSHGACNVASSSLGLITNTMSTIFTAMIGLVGSVVGFYFGSQKQGGG